MRTLQVRVRISARVRSSFFQSYVIVRRSFGVRVSGRRILKVFRVRVRVRARLRRWPGLGLRRWPGLG